MADAFPPPSEPRWPRLLSLAVHEFRTPVTVVAGYIRMLLKDRAGPLSDQQRRLLEEAEKSCGRLSGLTAEMSDLANLEAGSAPFNRRPQELAPLLDEVIASLPPLPDRDVPVTFDNQAGHAMVDADPVRLRAAMGAVLVALRRELVSNAPLVVRLRRSTSQDHPGLWLVIADGERLDAVDSGAPSAFGVFDEWRGGCGLSLAVARRIVAAHGGRMWSPLEDGKAGAVIALPEAAAGTGRLSPAPEP